MREQLGTAGALGGSLSPRCGFRVFGFLFPGIYVPGFLLSPLPRLNGMLPLPRLNEMLPASAAERNVAGASFAAE